MNAVEIEEAVSELMIEPFDRAEFPFQFLEAFGNNETTLKRLRKGSTNRTDIDGAILQNRNIHILATDPAKGAKGFETGLKALRDSPKTAQQKAKLILATDGYIVTAEDLNSGETRDCPLHPISVSCFLWRVSPPFRKLKTTRSTSRPPDGSINLCRPARR